MIDTIRFTPGPWDSQGGIDVIAEDWGHHIATCWNNNVINPDQAIANARLIAAAPDLYVACQAVLEVVGEGEVRDLILIALTRALGEEELI